ncbi:MAG: GPO family capsid scaffolding protein [Moraxellaceae bacterium]|nr:GPO family capsid scaffolding protein [Moraxellaceae bacterium]
MSKKFKRVSKFFRIGVEGATTDGRMIERSWLEQMAAAYSPSTYGARINLEHFKGIDPNGLFKAYGDVIALKTEEIEIGGKKKLALLAQVKPTDELIALNEKAQKVYTSMEVQPDFAKTGKAYLVGLAVTDSPASLGTEMLEFSAKNGALKSRKLHADNLFSAAEEVVFEFEEIEEEPGLLDKVKALFSKRAETDEARFGDVYAAVEEIAQHQADLADKVATIGTPSALPSAFTELKAAHDKLTADFAALVAKLNATPDGKQRPVATGGNGDARTDC